MPGIVSAYKVSKVVLAGVVGLVAFSGAMASAQQRVEPPVAAATFSGGEIYFQPRVGASAWTLTVTGPNGFVLERRGQGSPPSISVFDNNGHPLTDGSYSYQLQAEVKLSPAAFQKLSQDTPEGRDIALRPGQRVRELPPAAGHFRVAGGSIVMPTENEPQSRGQMAGPARRGVAPTVEGPVAEPDQVILDDLIVDGSACIGQDCVNGESFGFDTIRIKENNLRIRAQDTSATSSFPTNDWQITFNDSANGGLNKFSIDDIDGGRTPFTIEASAPSHSLYVDDGGRVGFGTAAPVVEMHVVNGDSPTLRLEQNGSSGFTPQTWDVAGNETNFFIRDATNGSTLPIRLRPGAPSNSIFVETNGRVGLGDSSPDAPLDVRGTTSTIGTGNAALKLVNTGGPVALQLDALDNGVFWNFGVPSDDLFRISRSGTGAAELEMTSDGDLTIRGDLTVSGTCTGCDGMFQPDYAVESLEEHATFMWENSFLPDVGPTPDGHTQIQVFKKTAGMLKELEKAHIYIAPLNDNITEKDAEVADLRERLARLERLLTSE
jgi:hypothetical protein